MHLICCHGEQVKHDTPPSNWSQLGGVVSGADNPEEDGMNFCYRKW